MMSLLRRRHTPSRTDLVEITATDGTVTGVNVDAGDDTVLAQDTDSDTETNDE
ncbi:hypothetical protein ABIB15_001149 [Marisediminicola sp. UYEF4]